jgi:hypothetical protein
MAIDCGEEMRSNMTFFHYDSGGADNFLAGIGAFDTAGKGFPAVSRAPIPSHCSDKLSCIHDRRIGPMRALDSQFETVNGRLEISIFDSATADG